MKQTCGNCQWGAFDERTNHKISRPVAGSPGWCRYPVRETCLLPASVDSILKTSIRPESGVGCLVWEAKRKEVSPPKK